MFHCIVLLQPLARVIFIVLLMSSFHPIVIYIDFMQINHLPGNSLLSGLLQDTYVVFGIFTSLFTVNVSVKQITVDHALEYPS